MKVERQGPKECMLATMAALRGVSLESVRQRACYLACTTRWEDIFNTNVRINGKIISIWEHVVRKLAQEMNLPIDRILTYSLDGIPMTPAGRANLAFPEKGKGTITTFITFENEVIQHICPFEDGLIYDPEAFTDYYREHGQTLADYISSHDNAYGRKGATKVINIAVIEE